MIRAALILVLAATALLATPVRAELPSKCFGGRVVWAVPSAVIARRVGQCADRYVFGGTWFAPAETGISPQLRTS